MKKNPGDTSKPEEPRGMRKAAIMLITLDADTSGKIFQALPEEDM